MLRVLDRARGGRGQGVHTCLTAFLCSRQPASSIFPLFLVEFQVTVDVILRFSIALVTGRKKCLSTYSHLRRSIPIEPTPPKTIVNIIMYTHTGNLHTETFSIKSRLEIVGRAVVRDLSARKLFEIN